MGNDDKKIEKVIFVCENNLFLSPMAESMFRNSGGAEDIEVISRGLVVLFEEPINPKVNLLLTSHGKDLCKHGNSCQLKKEDITEKTCVFTMTLGEKVKVMEEYGAQIVYTLGEFSGINVDIINPYGKESEAYEEAFGLLDMCIQASESKIKSLNGGIGMIAIGCDHGGYELKQEIIGYLDVNDIPYNDFGCYDNKSCDYPVYAKAVANSVAKGECEKGIIICGTGIGVSMTANKIPGIRAALCHDTFSAEATRLHNDANVLTMGARVIGPGLALKIVDTFLNTEFSKEERHQRRINMMENS